VNMTADVVVQEGCEEKTRASIASNIVRNVDQTADRAADFVKGRDRKRE
jgi:hypothetical protein